MNGILEAFWQGRVFEFHTLLEAESDEIQDRLRVDNSQMDFSEDDPCGIATYWDGDELVATRDCAGGGDERWEYTAYGRNLMWGALTHVIRKVR